MAGQQSGRALACLVLLSSGVVGAPQDQPKDATRATDPSDLGFELSEVPAPDPEKGTPVARVFYDYLYSSEAQPKSDPRATDPAPVFVWSSLRKNYIDQNEITATEDEINRYVDAMSTAQEQAELTVPGRKLPEDQKARLEGSWREMAVQKIVNWKMDKQLYRRYGGPVVFQQANPLEPVGAYRTFLKHMEEAKVFEIFDDDARARFWKRFAWEDSTVIPRQEVDFSKPWWRQLERQPGLSTPDGDSR